MNRSNCPVCSHPKADVIEMQITAGIDLDKIAAHFGLGIDDIPNHIRHGSDGVVMPEPLSPGDEYSTLQFVRRQLKLRFDNLIASSAATPESKELIQLSRAINDTVKATVLVREKLGHTDDTRAKELEKMFDELMMVIPQLCPKDQQLIEKALRLEALVE